MTSLRLRREIRAALLWPFPYLFRVPVQHLDFSQLRTVIAAYRSIATPPTALFSLAGKLSSKLPWFNAEGRNAASAP